MSKAWKDAHVSYDDFLHEDAAYVARSPHGKLFINNSFLDLLRSSDTVRLLHITTALDKVLPGKELLPSGGCLVGSLYCVPLFTTPRGLRAHNLGSYIFEHEIRRCLKSKEITGRTVSPLIVEVTSRKEARVTAGVDYLRLGDVHLRTFTQLESTISSFDRKKLERSVIERTARSRQFLQLCYGIARHDLKVNKESFFAFLVNTIPSLPILGYLYFEALTEYIMLFSRDERTLMLAWKGELNCWAYKEVIFKLQPNLLRSFNLGAFRPTLQDLYSVLGGQTKKGIIALDMPDLITSVKTRMCSLVCRRLLLGQEGSVADMFDSKDWSFDLLRDVAPYLLGHIIDREIRHVDVYGRLQYYFDRHKAQQAWEYWSDAGIDFPFNGILPKGEVGFNPMNSRMRHSIFQGIPSYRDGELYFDKGEEFDLQVVPRFLDPEHAFMGITTSKYKNKEYAL